MNIDELNKILENHKKEQLFLRRANLQNADLRKANICGANLMYADLQGANLQGADLRDADLWEADLRHANLCGADLRGADLRGADIRGADLRGADLTRAHTDGMKTDAETKTDWPMSCPESGSFIAWKKAGEYDAKCKMIREYIVKLEIPEDACRSSATTEKCRASKAKVLEIQKRNGTKANKTEVKSSRGKTYKVGKMVYPDEWDYNRWNECSNGIHFFMTRDEAVAW